MVREDYTETLTYTRVPIERWKRIRINNAIRRRTRVAGTFPGGEPALMPITAKLKYVADSEWGSRHYLDVSLLEG